MNYVKCMNSVIASCYSLVIVKPVLYKIRFIYFLNLLNFLNNKIYVCFLKENIKIDKAEEDLMLKELLKDDFVDDPSLEPDYENCPIKLPLSEGNLWL